MNKRSGTKTSSVKKESKMKKLRKWSTRKIEKKTLKYKDDRLVAECDSSGIIAVKIFKNARRPEMAEPPLLPGNIDDSPTKTVTQLEENDNS